MSSPKLKTAEKPLHGAENLNFFPISTIKLFFKHDYHKFILFNYESQTSQISLPALAC